MKKNLILGLSMLVLVPFVTNAKGCENYTNEEYNYIIEQSDPNTWIYRAKMVHYTQMII